jgi:hypothetical protein
MGRERPRRGRHRLLPSLTTPSTAITDESSESAPANPSSRELIRGAVIHLIGEQPIVADLFGYPSPADSTILCTNVRGTTGKRPVWADHTESMFYFPWAQVRFLEVPMNRRFSPSDEAGTDLALRESAEPDLEIDEEFLRRVRDV